VHAAGAVDEQGRRAEAVEQQIVGVGGAEELQQLSDEQRAAQARSG